MNYVDQVLENTDDFDSSQDGRLLVQYMNVICDNLYDTQDGIFLAQNAEDTLLPGSYINPQQPRREQDSSMCFTTQEDTTYLYDTQDMSINIPPSQTSKVPSHLNPQQDPGCFMESPNITQASTPEVSTSDDSTNTLSSQDSLFDACMSTFSQDQQGGSPTQDSVSESVDVMESSIISSDSCETFPMDDSLLDQFMVSDDNSFWDKETLKARPTPDEPLVFNWSSDE